MEILTVAGVTAILVTIMTLIFQYFPGLRVKWAGVASEWKRLIVLGLYFVFGAIVAFGGCLPAVAQFLPQLLCVDSATFLQYVIAMVIAVGSGQGIFELLPETQDVTAAKYERVY